MKTTCLILMLAAGFAISCDKQPVTSEPLQLSQTELKVLRQGNDFGLDLFARLGKDDPRANLCISPYSVYTALAMTANGAGTETLDEIIGLLGFAGKELSALNESVKNLNSVLITKDPSTVFETANSVWYNTNGFMVYPAFVSSMENWFSAKVEGVDFSSLDALPAVNGWVNEKTHGKIDKIIERINPEDVCFLINALYFNGTWATLFDKRQTQLLPFTPSAGKQVQVPTMYLQDSVNAIQSAKLTAAELPYGDGSWSMYIFMPPAGTVLDDWCSEELAANWSSLREQFEPVPGMELYLPQFKMETSLELSEALKKLGMPTAFSGAADFSALGPGSLAISQVLHKTFIDVNEEGTEAAAVTAVVITRTSMPVNQVRFNRPFIFVIAEKSTGAILFVGKLVDPL